MCWFCFSPGGWKVIGHNQTSELRTYNGIYTQSYCTQVTYKSVGKTDRDKEQRWEVSINGGV